MIGEKALNGALKRLESRPKNNLSDVRLKSFINKNWRNSWGQGFYLGWKQGK